MIGMRALRVATLSVLAIILSGLPAAASNAAERGHTLHIVVSIKPLEAIAAAVMEGAGEPDLLLSGAAATPHGYNLKPSQMRALNRADVVFWVGPELETFLKGPLAGLPKTVRVVSLLDELRRYKARGGRAVVWPLRTPGHWEAGVQARPAKPGETADPHIWLDYRNGAALAAIMAEALAQADPDHANLFRARAWYFRDKLEGHITRMARLLHPVKDRPFIVFHDSYQYLERDFGLHAVAAVAGGAHIHPGAAHLGRLRAMLKDGQAVCVFVEPQFPPRIAKTLVRGTSARLGELDPLGGSLPKGPGSYALLLTNLARSLADCLGGHPPAPH